MVPTSRTALGVLPLLVLAGPPPPAAAKPVTPVYEKFLHREGPESLESLFAKELDLAKRAKKHVVVVFTADWCTPCKALKEFLDEDEVVRKAARKGHLLFIDVDEWRGPAHSLIAGANPDKLPLVVRVDDRGKLVATCFGSEMGLLSPEMTATNLERFIDGKPLLLPDYETDEAKRSELLRALAKRRAAKTPAGPTVTLDVRFRPRGKDGPWSVHLAIRNHDQRRRWFAVPIRVGDTLPAAPRVRGWEQIGFAEHVRAHYHLFSGDTPFAVFPVAGEGSIDLEQWRLEGPPGAATLTVYELDRVTVDGKALEFDKKVPYELRVEDASRTHVQADPPPPSKVELGVAKKHELKL